MAGSRPQFMVAETRPATELVAVATSDWATVSAGDGTQYDGLAFWVGTTGNVRIQTRGGTAVTLTSCYGHIPYGLTAIFSTSTTAADIVVVTRASGV